MKCKHNVSHVHSRRWVCIPGVSGAVLASAIVLGAFVAPVVGAATVRAETMEEALGMAYDVNPELQSARAGLRATDELVPQALSGWRPSVEANASGAKVRTRKSTNPGVTDKTSPRTYGIGVVQPIFSGGQTIAGTAGAAQRVLAGRARLAATEQQVLLNAATAYLDVLHDLALLDLNVRNEQVLARHLQATRDRFSVGEITRTDVHLSEARHALATANRIQAEGVLDVSRATYTNVIGQAPGALSRPALSLNLPKNLDEAVALATRDNFSVVAAEHDEQAANNDIDVTRGGMLPSVNLSGNASRQHNTLSSGYKATSYEARLSLSVPLYQSGLVRSKLRGSKQQAIAARENVRQSRRDSVEQATRAWQTLQATRARIESFQIQVRAAKTALEGIEREASVGSRTVLDVLDSKQELLDAEVNLVRSQRDETIAALQLMAAVGRLTARDLNLKVDLYDAQGHYLEVRDQWFGTQSSGDSDTLR